MTPLHPHGFEEITILLPSDHPLNRSRQQTDYASPTTTILKPEGVALHSFRSRAAELLSQHNGTAWLTREIPNSATGELELRIAVKSSHSDQIRQMIMQHIE